MTKHLWKIITNAIPFVIAFLIMTKAHSSFETITFALLGIIYTNIRLAVVGITYIQLQTMAEVNRQSLEIKKLLNNPFQKEDMEEAKKDSEMLKESSRSDTMEIVFLGLLDVVFVGYLVSAFF